MVKSRLFVGHAHAPLWRDILVTPRRLLQCAATPSSVTPRRLLWLRRDRTHGVPCNNKQIISLISVYAMRTGANRSKWKQIIWIVDLRYQVEQPFTWSPQCCDCCPHTVTHTSSKYCQCHTTKPSTVMSTNLNSISETRFTRALVNCWTP